jgi:LmbE family N-acetylglucosaminyl deacetylase
MDARAAGFSDWRSYAEARRHELAAAMAEAGVDGTGLVCLAVPDKEAVHHLVDLARRLADLFRAHRIEVVATHAYEGGHADHDAAAFAVHAAAALLAREGVEPPGIVEMPFYTWRGEGLLPLRFLPRPDAPETAIRLDPAALALKRRMLAAFRTQARVLADFSAASIERFRRAPRHDFTRPANGGDTGYARITPAIDARRWCLFAAKAERELGLR